MEADAGHDRRDACQLPCRGSRGPGAPPRPAAASASASTSASAGAGAGAVAAASTASAPAYAAAAHLLLPSLSTMPLRAPGIAPALHRCELCVPSPPCRTRLGRPGTFSATRARPVSTLLARQASRCRWAQPLPLPSILHAHLLQHCESERARERERERELLQQSNSVCV